MLDLESRMEILGVTVYRDLDDPKRFFYAATDPHIAREDGRALFDLFAYSKGGEADEVAAGGFLNMAVATDLGDRRGRLESELESRFGGDVTLAAIPYTKGTVRVIALGESSAGEETNPAADAPVAAAGPRFIETILSSGQPSLDGDNRAIFSFSLSQDGAAFFLDVLSGDVDARPVGVVYELGFVGLLAAYDLEITIDFTQSYDYMRQRFTLGTLFFRADIDNIVEELQRQEAITIREVARTLELSTPEAMAARQARIDTLVKDLATGALFQPSLAPGQPKVQGDTITAADPTGAATSATGISGALRDGAGAAAAAGMANTAGVRAGLAGSPDEPEAGDGTGGDHDPGAGDTGIGGTGTGSDETGTGSSTTAADVWNRLGRPQAAFALKRVSQQEQRTVTYNLSQVSAQEQSIAPQNFIQFLADSRELSRHVHLVNLNHPFFEQLNINVTAADVDFAVEGITQMTVQLRYGTRPDGTAPKDTAEAILRDGDTAKDFVFFADEHGTQTYDYKLVVDYRSGFGIGIDALRLESDWITTDARSLVPHPRQLGQVLPIELRLAPDVPEELTELHARVRYVDSAGTVDESTLVVLTPGAPSGHVVIRLADPAEQFSVTSTALYNDSTSEELGTVQWPQPTAGGAQSVLVLAPPVTNRLTGDIILQDPLAELDAVLVDTEVSAGGATLLNRTFELTQSGSAGRQLISVRLPQGTTPSLRFQERRLFKDGGVETEDWREAASSNLLVGIPAADLKPVVVRWVGPDPATIGISLVVVDVRYEPPDGDPEFEQEKSLMIDSTPTSQLQEWAIRLPDATADDFQFRISTFFADGTTVEGEFQTTDRSPLIVRPQG